ncbi:2-amino-4-hydroxy-6-hydroxymethyldihydropteridine diphosphokinase [Victivallis vadensis]|uniref:2-amino-4-hydroxy-6-hydroxymethyldihydropteridine pyrophosphokinase n=2 Tax=Victivallis vadensis TaxID=172901 RepID=A0A2U1AFH1_9BACT|nr:2-amino-4-hydroxy-6-hydroxymethyldihydropteridine diphosphokinase [Victivallis vadensis]PVY35155.1 2-amino-4-hydroxy-6-hydroxymethyldihydropteridine diphosphokinase [Victivallis vadensis]PWM81563.1 MAG: 2-amino-4-hydroxy-6-hydroxymethyldihydropteridine diphosphokinase [Lentisphaerota bacterium]
MLKTTKFAIMLGGNQGNSPEIFRNAVEKLAAAGVVRPVQSRLFRTAAVDCVPGTPDFCNAALIGEWAGSAEELLAVCQRLEREAGRPEKHSSRESRPLDLDLILFGDERRETAFLRLPHPRAQERGFVLMPLAEVAGKWRFPDSGRTVRECLENLPPEKLN